MNGSGKSLDPGIQRFLADVAHFQEHRQLGLESAFRLDGAAFRPDAANVLHCFFIFDNIRQNFFQGGFPTCLDHASAALFNNK